MVTQSDGLLDQRRWNQYGRARAEAIDADSREFIISQCPFGRWEAHKELLRLLGSVRGKKILEVGCGLGDFSVWLSMQGADVIATDIGPDLVNAGVKLAEANNASCTFRQAGIASLPVESSTQDIVVGVSILHHLSETDVVHGLRECFRVLNRGGRALFCEPVENSRLFDAFQNLFPVWRKGDRYYRPSWLQRKEWAAYISRVDERSMTTHELRTRGNQIFRETRIWPHGFLVRLVGLIGDDQRERLQAVDRVLFRIVPPIRHFCQVAVVEYVK